MTDHSPSNQSKPIRGTREWAVANIDCCTGCPHDCLYCYARYDAVVKRGIISSQEWSQVKVRCEEVVRKQPLFPGQVMFPTAHDIVPENLDSCITVLRHLLIAGNEVLVVSKPNLACVHTLCEELAEYKKSILFRFTITARDRAILKFWEPGAPDYEERKKCLALAYENGYATSVSVEPMLDTDDVVSMVGDLLPYVSHSIWLGKMNKIDQRVRSTNEDVSLHVAKIKDGQRDEVIQRIYNQLSHQSLVCWKESIKEVVGLKLSEKPGLDR